MKNIKHDIFEIKRHLNIYKRELCSEEESNEFKNLIKENKPLPDGIFKEEGTEQFFKYLKPKNITNEDINEYLILLQVKYLKTIKNCVVFFTILAVIGIMAGMILGMLLK